MHPEVGDAKPLAFEARISFHSILYSVGTTPFPVSLLLIMASSSTDGMLQRNKSVTAESIIKQKKE
jgi:hypothetical protein